MRPTVAATIACISMILPALVSAGVATARPAAQQGDPRPGAAERSDVLSVTSVSPWVTSEGTFTVSFRTAGLPSDAVVKTTIHQRLRPEDGTLREAAEDQLSRDAVPRNLQAPITKPLAELPTRNGSATIEVPVRSGSGADRERQLVPTPGIHPVTIEVASPAGASVAVATVFLNRLPEEAPEGRDGEAATTSVQLLAAIDSSPALGVDGHADLSTEEGLAVSTWEVMLTENRDLPLTVALRPNTLLGLQRSEDPSEAAFVDDLAGTAFNVAAQSYVKVDAAAMSSAGGGAFDQQLASGRSILTSITGRPPEGIWMFDDTVNTEAAERLARSGVEHLFVSSDRLALPDVRRSMRSTLEKNRTLALAGVEDMTVSSYDAEVSRLLLEADLPPGLSAHRAATALMASWFDAVKQGAESFPGVSSAIVLSPGSSHEVLTELVSALTRPGPLAVSEPTVPTVDGKGEQIVARLRQREVDSAKRVVDRWGEAATRIAGFASMSMPGDPTTSEWTLLNDQTLAIAADAGSRNAVWDHIDVALDNRLAMIQTPPPRSVVLTSRSDSIPLRIRNRSDTPVTVRMTTRSPRLDFPAGATRDVRLDPGENRIEVPVEVQAPGSSLMRIDLTSPDGVLSIREVQVTVRSWSISGVGAVLSIVSLAVLALWWVRTFRRRRRPAHTAGSADPAHTAGSADPPGDVGVPGAEHG